MRRPAGVPHDGPHLLELLKAPHKLLRAAVSIDSMSGCLAHQLIHGASLQREVTVSAEIAAVDD